MFERAGQKSSNVKSRQVWQHNNKPIELWSSEVINQKVDYTRGTREGADKLLDYAVEAITRIMSFGNGIHWPCICIRRR